MIFNGVTIFQRKKKKIKHGAVWCGAIMHGYECGTGLCRFKGDAVRCGFKTCGFRKNPHCTTPLSSLLTIIILHRWLTHNSINMVRITSNKKIRNYNLPFLDSDLGLAALTTDFHHRSLNSYPSEFNFFRWNSVFVSVSSRNFCYIGLEACASCPQFFFLRISPFSCSSMGIYRRFWTDFGRNK